MTIPPDKNPHVSEADDNLRVVWSILLNPKTPYRQWSWPDPSLAPPQQKQFAERIVTRHFCEALAESEGKSFFLSCHSFEPDPPDTVVNCLDGGKWGIEVTEVLDSESQRQRVKQWRKDRSVTNRGREWHPEEVIATIQERIKAKNKPDSRGFSGGPYSRRVLVIYSEDEWLYLGFRRHLAMILQNAFGPAPHYDEAYFMAPASEGHAPSAPIQCHAQIWKLRLKGGP